MSRVQVRKRVEKFRRNHDLEQLLGEINEALWCAESTLLPQPSPSDLPLLFIVGPHRSGSTLLMQWLANMGHFAYPTNLLSRFYKAPIIGSKIQLLLTDERYNYRNEIMDFEHKVDFTSHNGKTTGALAPNEFWYFWRRFLPFTELDYLPTDELEKQVDIKTLRAEVSGIASVLKKPLVMKALILNYNIDFLAQHFPNAIFLYSQRDPLTNIASALNARITQYDDIEEWYSFKIPEYPKLKSLSAYEQVAGQIYHINYAVEQGLASVPAQNKLFIGYEELCANPERIYVRLRDKLQGHGYELPATYVGPSAFKMTRDNVSDEAILSAYHKFYGN